MSEENCKTREVLTVKEAAKLLKVSQEAVRKLVKRGDLDGFRIDRRFRVFLDSLPNYKSNK